MDKKWANEYVLFASVWSPVVPRSLLAGKCQHPECILPATRLLCQNANVNGQRIPQCSTCTRTHIKGNGIDERIVGWRERKGAVGKAEGRESWWQVLGNRLPITSTSNSYHYARTGSCRSVALFCTFAAKSRTR